MLRSKCSANEWRGGGRFYNALELPDLLLKFCSLEILGLLICPLSKVFLGKVIFFSVPLRSEMPFAEAKIITIHYPGRFLAGSSKKCEQICFV